jgi:hypothetical protein
MKFFLFGLAAAFDHEMVSMMKDVVKDKPTFVEIEFELSSNKTIDPKVEQVTELLLEHHREQLLGAPDGCKDCIDRVVKCWYHVAFQKVGEWCAKETKCPIKKKICKIFKDEPEVFAGMLFVWGHPIDDGYFYCMGKGECKPQDLLTTFGKGDGITNMEEIVLSDAKEWEKDEEPTSEIELWQTESEIEDLLLQGELQTWGMGMDKDGGYKKCVKKASCWVMKKVIHKICAWCKKATKPEDKAKCAWMKAHKKFTFGALLAAVQPWKYAMGYCCPHEGPKKYVKKFAETFGFMKRDMSHKVQEKEFHA